LPAAPVLVALVLTLGPAGAGALTTPQPGATARPAGLTLAAPFPCQTTYKVVCGYGCSGLHKNINEPLKANDYHALDLIRDEAGSGFDKPVTALASGTVKYAGWASGGWSTYGQIVIIALDFTDGQSYQVLYAHLNKVSVSNGQHVKARDAVGTLGASGNNSLTYWSAKHLHLAFYRAALVGTGGPYGGVAAVPEPMDGVQDFVTNQTAKVSCAPPPDAGPPKPDAKVADGAPADQPGELPPVVSDHGVAPQRPDDGGCSCALAARRDAAPSDRAVLLVLLLLLSALPLLRGRRLRQPLPRS